MSNWGDDIDVELQNCQKLKVGFLLSFKSMTLALERLVQETRESDDKYPKSEFLKIWASIMLVFTVLLIFTYSVFAIATLLFMFFYGYAFFQLCRAWNSFKYSKFMFWGMTLAGIVVSVLISNVFRGMIFGV